MVQVQVPGSVPEGSHPLALTSWRVESGAKSEKSVFLVPRQ